MKMLPFIILSLLSACKYEVPEPPTSNPCPYPPACDTVSHQNRFTELLWQVPFESGPDLNLIHTIKLYKDDVIAYYWDFQDSQIRLMSCKQDKGDVNYRFKFSKVEGEGDSQDDIDSFDDWVGLSTDYDAGFVNLLNGKELLIPEDKFCFTGPVQRFKNKFYRAVWSCDDKSSHIFSYDLLNGNKVDTVISRTIIDNPAGAHLGLPIIFYESVVNGQSFIITNNYGAGTLTIPVKQELICYNLGTKKIKWKVDNNFGKNPILDGRYCFLSTPKGQLNKIDLETGELIWSFIPDNGGASFLTSTGLLKGDILYTMPINDVLYALDKYTAKVLWKGKRNGTSTNCNPVYVNGKLIIGFYQAIAVYDALSGKELAYEKAWNYKWGTRFEACNYDQNMAVDLQNNLLYCSDGFYLQCFKVK